MEPDPRESDRSFRSSQHPFSEHQPCANEGMAAGRNWEDCDVQMALELFMAISSYLQILKTLFLIRLEGNSY